MPHVGRLVAWGLAISAPLALLAPLLAAAPAPAPKESLPPKQWDSQTLSVFPEKPLSRLKGPRPAVKEASSPDAPAAPDGGDGGSTPGKFVWSKMISPETLANEIKSQRVDIADHVKNIGVFRGGGNRHLRRDFAVVAAMFGITAEYDQPIRFKPVAGAARDAFARAAANAKAADDNTFNESKARGQDLEDMIQGGTVEFPSPQPEPKWGQLIERRQLMLRLDQAYEKRMRPAVANAQQFGKSKDAVLHEAEMIAAIAEIISREGFESSDDAEYAKYATALKKNALAAVAATRENNFNEAQRAAGEISKACAACHGAFK